MCESRSGWRAALGYGCQASDLNQWLSESVTELSSIGSTALSGDDGGRCGGASARERRSILSSLPALLERFQ